MRLARFLLPLGFILPLATLAQTVSLNVDAGQVVRKVDERVFGLNAVIWDPQAGSAATLSLLQAAGVRTIRIPGGSLSDEYHWSTNKSLANTWSWASGVNNFSDLITGLNCQAIVTVNYGTGTPEEAAAWVAYANASATLLGTASDVTIGTDAKGTNWKTAGYWSALRAASKLASDDGSNFLRTGRTSPLGLEHWEIGNECYGTWETDQQAVAHDPYTYAVRARDYIARMKAVDRTISVGVVATVGEDASANNTLHPATNPRTGLVHNGWMPVMLATLKAQGTTPDFAIYHRYEQAPKVDQPNNPETDAGLLQKAKTWSADATALRQHLTDYLGTTAGNGVEMLVTENNSVYADPGKQTTSLVNGLYLADSIGNVLQTEFNALVWWDVRNGTDKANNNDASLYGWRNYGDYGILSTPPATTFTGAPTTYYEPYPTYYVMKLLSRFAREGDSVVKATSSSSLLSIFAVTKPDGTLNLLLLNKDPGSTLSASITLAGYTPASSATVYTYGMTQDNAAKPGGSGLVDIATTTMNVAGATFTTSFTPYSATVISLSTGPAPAPTPTPTPTPTPSPSVKSGGGGGGAPSLWFAGALFLLGAYRWWRRCQG